MGCLPRWLSPLKTATMFRSYYDLGPYCSGIEYVETVEPVTGQTDLVIIGMGDEPVVSDELAARRGRRPQPQ